MKQFVENPCAGIRFVHAHQGTLRGSARAHQGTVRGSARGVCSDEQLSQHLTCWTEMLADEPLDLLQGLTGPPETSEGREVTWSVLSSRTSLVGVGGDHHVVPLV